MPLTKEQQKVVTDNHNLIYWYIQMKRLDINDWYDLLAIELCYTVIKYNPDKGSLSNYFKMRADNLMRKEYSKTQLKKNKEVDPLSFDDDLYSSGYDDDFNSTVELEQFMSGENGDILQLRAEGYTQAEIADKLGVTQSYISKIIDKKRREYHAANRQADC